MQMYIKPRSEWDSSEIDEYIEFSECIFEDFIACDESVSLFFDFYTNDVFINTVYDEHLASFSQFYEFIREYKSVLKGLSFSVMHSEMWFGRK